jgi:hypothetical protein
MLSLPSPQAATEQSLLQVGPSVSGPRPGSQTSPLPATRNSGLTRPSPHDASVQSTLQLGVLTPGRPGSHFSVDRLRWLSPQMTMVQSLSQAVVSTPGWPLSHCSPAAGSTLPLPQPAPPWQSLRQPSRSLLLPSSQTSLKSLMPLPQVSSDRQLGLQ